MGMKCMGGHEIFLYLAEDEASSTVRVIAT